MTDVELMEVFRPTSDAIERVPFKGFTEQRMHEREDELRAMKARHREIRRLAANPDTPNRAVWNCLGCHRTFSRGEPFWFTYSVDRMVGEMKCQECHSKTPTERAPIVQATLVREVL